MGEEKENPANIDLNELTKDIDLAELTENSNTGLCGAEVGPDGKEKYKYAWPFEECNDAGKEARWEYEHPQPWGYDICNKLDDDITDLELDLQMMWFAEQAKAVHPERWEAIWSEEKYKALLEKEGLEVAPLDLAPRCTFTKSTGQVCNAYALRDTDLCYVHSQTSAKRRKKARRKFLELPVLEDDLAVQIAVTNICRAVAEDSLEPKRAATLLYGMQVAIQSLRRKKQQGEQESSAAREPW